MIRTHFWGIKQGIQFSDALKKTLGMKLYRRSEISAGTDRSHGGRRLHRWNR